MADLHFYYSTMNAGKSAVLLQTAHNYRSRGMKVILLTSGVDTREGVGIIHSRTGLMSAAEIYKEHDNIIDIVEKHPDFRECRAIFVDEAQFLTSDQVWQLSDLADKHDIEVRCYGIRTDFMGELFDGSRELLAIADKLTEIETICECGRKATMVYRMNEKGDVVVDGPKIVIGGEERYVSCCRQCFKMVMSS